MFKLKIIIISIIIILLSGCVIMPGPIGVVGEYGTISVQPYPITVINDGYYYNRPSYSYPYSYSRPYYYKPYRYYNYHHHHHRYYKY